MSSEISSLCWGRDQQIICGSCDLLSQYLAPVRWTFPPDHIYLSQNNKVNWNCTGSTCFSIKCSLMFLFPSYKNVIKRKWNRGGKVRHKEKKSSDRLDRSDKDQKEKHLCSQTGWHIFIPLCLFQLCQCDWSSDIPSLSVFLKRSLVFLFSQHLPTDMQMQWRKPDRGKGAKSNILNRGIRSFQSIARLYNNNCLVIIKSLLVRIMQREQYAFVLLLVLIVKDLQLSFKSLWYYPLE